MKTFQTASLHAIARMVIAATAFAAFPLFAQDAATLKTRFSTLFSSSTTGTYAKIVWMKMRDNMRKPDVDPADILVMDTRDGIIRTLVPAGTAVFAPSITKDGKHVIYFNNSDLTVHRVTWDGTKDTIILRNWEGGGRTWQSSDSKQWVLATEFKGDGVNGAGLYRVNVNNPTERVLLLTCATWSRVSWMGSTSWASISGDGSYVAGGFPNYGGLGTFRVKSPVATSVRKLSPNGCWISMCQDNSYRTLFTNDGSLTHKEIYISDTTGKKITSKSLVGGILKNSTDGFESLRWTSDPDYCTFWSGWYQSGQCDGRNTKNPKIVRISDLAWEPIHDNCTTAEGNCDVLFYTDPTFVRSAISARVKPADAVSTGARVFDCRGREVSDRGVEQSAVLIGSRQGKPTRLLAGSSGLGD